MCVIYLFKKGCLEANNKSGKLYKKIERDFYTNNDGCGYSYIEEGKIKIKKYLEKDCFKKVFMEVLEANKKSVVMLHFRIATGSRHNEVNTHPFLMKGGQIVFCHNGILNEKYFSSDTLTSDTVKLKCMLEEYKVNPFNIKDEFTMMLFEKFFEGNKLVFMNKKQEIKIVNEGLGEWYAEGIWVSYKEAIKYGSNKCGYYSSYESNDYLDYDSYYDYDYDYEEEEEEKGLEKMNNELEEDNKIEEQDGEYEEVSIKVNE